MNPEEFGFPIYLPASGRLLIHWFSSRELGIDPDEFDRWFKDHLDETIGHQYGREAVILRLDADKGALHQTPCPKCHLKELTVHINVG